MNILQRLFGGGKPKDKKRENTKELFLRAQESTDPIYVEQVMKIIIRREGDSKMYRKLAGYHAFLKRANLGVLDTEGDQLDGPIARLLFGSPTDEDDGEDDE